MRFTPSTNWDLISKAAHRRVIWKIERKITSDASEALSAGTWVDITPYTEPFPGCRQSIEFEVGQFKSDSVSIRASAGMFEGGVIQWFKDNVFNAAADEYIEIRISATMKLGTISTSDTFYAFSGFVDKYPVYNELLDSVEFTVYTYDDLGTRISAENVCTQYVDSDVDGAGTDGLVLPLIPGAFAIDANISTVELKVGLHAIEYEYNAGTPQFRMDNGAWVNAPGVGIDDDITLTSEDGLEQLKLWVRRDDLPNDAETHTDYVVVITSGDVLPKQPYYGLSIKPLLKLLYAEIGITTVTLDTSLEIPTADGNTKLSFLDNPPMDSAVSGKRTTVAFDGTYLWVAVGSKIYKRDMVTETYTLKHTIAGTVQVAKMLFNSRNNELWILYGTDGGVHFNKVLIYNTISDTTSGTYTSGSSALGNTAVLIDYNYSGSDYYYGLIFTAGTNAVYLDDTLTATTIKAGNAHDTLTYLKNGNEIYYFDSSAYIYKLHINSSGAVVDDGRVGSALFEYSNQMPCAYNSSANKIFFFEPGTVQTGYWTPGAASSTTGLSGHPEFMFYGGDNKVYASMIYNSDNTRYLFQYDDAGGDSLVLDYPMNIGEGNSSPMSQSGGVIYGVDSIGRLFKIDDSLQMSVISAVYSGTTVKEEIDKILQGYNLIGIISSNKTAFVYRRSDDVGAIRTTGNQIAITISEAMDITEQKKAFPKYNYIEVSNGTETWSYDGTKFNSKVLGDVRRKNISCSILPSNMVKDLAKYFYTFFSTDRDIYEIPVSTAEMQYEPMDGAAITFSATKISRTADGIIIGQSINPDGSMVLEVLV